MGYVNCYGRMYCLLVIGGCFLDAYIDVMMWNDGVCKICGGHWHYLDVVGHRYSTDYIYQCNKCGRTFNSGGLFTVKN